MNVWGADSQPRVPFICNRKTNCLLGKFSRESDVYYEQNDNIGAHISVWCADAYCESLCEFYAKLIMHLYRVRYFMVGNDI